VAQCNTLPVNISDVIHDDIGYPIVKSLYVLLSCTLLLKQLDIGISLPCSVLSANAVVFRPIKAGRRHGFIQSHNGRPIHSQTRTYKNLSLCHKFSWVFFSYEKLRWIRTLYYSTYCAEPPISAPVDAFSVSISLCLSSTLTTSRFRRRAVPWLCLCRLSFLAL